MPWSGGVYTPTNGSYTGATLWSQAQSAGENVRTDRFDAYAADLKTVIENCLTRDGQNSPTQNLPMNARKHTGVADAAARSEYSSYGQMVDMAGVYVAASEVGGTADAITLAPTPAITSYTANLFYRFKAETDNTASMTIDVSGIGVKDLQKPNTTGGYDAMAAGDIQAGAVLEAWYDGTRFIALTGVVATGFSGDYNDLTNRPTIPNLGSDITTIDVLTQTAFDGISAKGASTLYLISG